jgi:hypothetical protein
MQAVGIVYKLDRDAETVVWHLKHDGDFNEDYPYPLMMHDIHVYDCPGYTECLLMYVNGAPESSARLVGIDETTMTATVVREWSEAGWEEPKMGGIQAIGDHLGGNWLVDEAHFELQSTNDRTTNIVEIAPDDSVVWRAAVSPIDISIYRTRRVDACVLFHHAGYCPSLE